MISYHIPQKLRRPNPVKDELSPKAGNHGSVQVLVDIVVVGDTQTPSSLRVKSCPPLEQSAAGECFSALTMWAEIAASLPTKGVWENMGTGGLVAAPRSDSIALEECWA